MIVCAQKAADNDSMESTGNIPGISRGRLDETISGFGHGMFKIKAAVLIILCLAHFFITFLYITPGPLSVDEAIYHWMAKSFSDQGSLDIRNGYDEFPSPELHHKYIRARDGKLVPQYPSLFAIVSLPFYKIFGFLGLFFMNSLAFAGVVAIGFLIAKKLFGDAELALDSCLVLTLATFAWEYSQAAWPHMFALFFSLCAFYLSVSAYHSEIRRNVLGLAFSSGAVAAFAMGSRLDGILIFPALILPFLFARPVRLAEIIAVIVGTLPVFALLSEINYVKFGVFNPFSYGEGPKVQIIPASLYAAGLASVGFAWLMSRKIVFDRINNHKKTAIFFMGLLTVFSIVLIPDLWEAVCRVMYDGYISAVDIRMLPTETIVAQRSSGGGVLYVGAHKKALLQSMPYLGLLLVPFLQLLRPDRNFFALAVLFITPVTVIAFYAYSFPFHDLGGLCLNTRYFIPALPFISILCAYGIRDLKRQWGFPFGVPATLMIAAATGGTYLYSIHSAQGSIDNLEYPILILPLWMAAGLSALVLMGMASKSKATEAIRTCAWVLIVTSMVWACIIALFYDYPAHRYARVVHDFYGKACFTVVPPDSILFSDNKSFAAATKLIEKDRVRIGFPPEDGFKDFPRLLEFQLKSGQRAFGLFHDGLWDQLRNGLLAGHVVKPAMQFQGFTLSEILLPGVEPDGQPR